MSKRLMIFVDGSNLWGGMGHYKNGYRLDMTKLLEELTGSRDRIRTYYYASNNVPPIVKQTHFYDKLSYMGIQCTIKDKRYGKEKGVDVALATDFLASAFKDNFEVAVIVSGDQDYEAAIQEVKDMGKIVEVASFKSVMSDAMKRTADRIIVLDDIAEKIKM